MSEYNKPQILVDVITNQRNDALNTVAEITTQNLMLLDLLGKSQAKVLELEAALAETNKEINTNVKKTRTKREAK